MVSISSEGFLNPGALEIRPEGLEHALSFTSVASLIELIPRRIFLNSLFHLITLLQFNLLLFNFYLFPIKNSRQKFVILSCFFPK